VPFGRTNRCFSWFASPLFQAGVIAICFLLPALHAHGQISAQMLDMANIVFEADELRQGDDGETVILRGNVLVEDGQNLLIADRVTLNTANGRAEASGNVVLDRGEEQVIYSDALLLDQPSLSLLLSNLSTRLGDEAVLAAAKASTGGKTTTLDFMAYTACEAPCVIDDYLDRDPLPWSLKARQAVLDEETGLLNMRGVRLEIFDVPVFVAPRLKLPSPSVKRRTGFLAPVGGFKSGDGLWGGIPLFVTLGPSADLTVMPAVYSSGLVRLDLENRLNTGALDAELKGTLDAKGRGGLMIEAEQQLSDVYDISLNLDWVGEWDQGTLRDLSQTGLDFHSNTLSLDAANGHSYGSLALHQDVVLTNDADFASLDWNSNWVPRAFFDLRLPPPRNGSRLKLSGQGILLDDQGLVESSLAWDARAITRSGLELTPSMEVGFIGHDAADSFQPWIGAQLGAALPLIRHDPQSSVSLTPRLALSGLTQASASGSPYDDQLLLSRSTLFDLRGGGDPFNHSSDLRLDAAFDVSIYPNRQSGDFGLRASLGQRLSLKDTALAPAIFELQGQMAEVKVDLKAEMESQLLLAEAFDLDVAAKALPRLALDVSVPLGKSVTLAGSHRRLQTDEDQRLTNTVRTEVDWTSSFSTSLGLSTRQSREATSLDVESGLNWNVSGDWVAETKWRQRLFQWQNNDVSFDLYHRCDCLGVQLGVLREQTASGTEYSARFALDLPTLFSASGSPTVFRHR